MARSQARIASMEQLKEETKLLGSLTAELDMKLWMYKSNLEDFLKEINHPKKDKLLNNIDQVISQFDKLAQAQRLVFNRQQQKQLLNAIEVVGLPEEHAQDLDGVVSILSKMLHIHIEKIFITGFERIGELNLMRNPRTLVVHLSDINIKKRLLFAAECTMLRVAGSDRPLYITEHLTPINHELLKKAKEEALRCNIDNVWVEDGKIFMRRGDHSLIHEITCENDIRAMRSY